MSTRTTKIEVSIRKDLVEVEDGGGFTIFAAQLQWLRQGLWQISWPADSLAGKYLLQVLASGEDWYRYGIVVRSTETRQVLFAGPFSTTILARGKTPGLRGGDGSVNSWGFTDWVNLHGHLLYPVPGTDVPDAGLGSLFSFGVFDDTETGPAEDVATTYINDTIGPSAGIVEKRLPGLVVPVSAGRGNTVEFGGRFQDLGDSVRTLCEVGGITGNLVYVPANTAGGAGTLEMQFDVPATRDDMLFSVDAGTVEGIQLKRQRSRINSSLVAADGSGAARPFGRVPLPPPPGGWHTRREEVVQRNDDTAGKVVVSGEDHLAGEAPDLGVEIDIGEGSPFEVGIDYNLGDIVPVSDVSSGALIEVEARVDTVILTFDEESGDSSRRLRQRAILGEYEQDPFAAALAKQILDDTRDVR